MKESNSVVDRLGRVAPAFIKELARRAELMRLRGDATSTTSLSVALDSMIERATPALRQALGSHDEPTTQTS